MILALEGPDCCGKTTVYEELERRWKGQPDWCFVPRLPNSKALMAVMPEVELRQAALWCALHDPRRLYVCDRHVCVSAPVYDAVYGRPCHVDGMLVEHIRAVYFEVPGAELLRRYKQRGDDLFDAENYGKLKREYERVLPRFQHTRILATEAPALLADIVERYACSEFVRTRERAPTS